MVFLDVSLLVGRAPVLDASMSFAGTRVTQVCARAAVQRLVRTAVRGTAIRRLTSPSTE